MYLDPTGNSYLTGNYSGGTPDFDPGPGIAIASGTAGCFIAKYDVNGNYLLAKSFGTSTSFGDAICVGSTGNIYVSGHFTGSGDFDPSSSVATLASAGSWDIFVTSFDANGNYVLAPYKSYTV